MKGKLVNSNFQIIDLLVQVRVAGVLERLILFTLHFATLQPWLHVGSFTSSILIHYNYSDKGLVLLSFFLQIVHLLSYISARL